MLFFFVFLWVRFSFIPSFFLSSFSSSSLPILQLQKEDFRWWHWLSPSAARRATIGTLAATMPRIFGHLVQPPPPIRAFFRLVCELGAGCASINCISCCQRGQPPPPPIRRDATGPPDTRRACLFSPVRTDRNVSVGLWTIRVSRACFGSDTHRLGARWHGTFWQINGWVKVVLGP